MSLAIHQINVLAHHPVNNDRSKRVIKFTLISESIYWQKKLQHCILFSIFRVIQMISIIQEFTCKYTRNETRRKKVTKIFASFNFIQHNIILKFASQMPSIPSIIIQMETIKEDLLLDNVFIRFIEIVQIIKTKFFL